MDFRGESHHATPLPIKWQGVAPGVKGLGNGIDLPNMHDVSYVSYNPSDCLLAVSCQNLSVPLTNLVIETGRQKQQGNILVWKSINRKRNEKAVRGRQLPKWESISIKQKKADGRMINLQTSMKG